MFGFGRGAAICGTEAVMLDINKEIELLERYASECSLIANLATDCRARSENEMLASDYQNMAEDLKSSLREIAQL
jgi:hypothetical protein